jgi:hypothetical protein
MKCINREPTLTNEANKALCVIQSDEVVEVFPLDGTNVSGLDAQTKIATGSMLLEVPTKKIYIMNEDEDGWGEWGGEG